MDSSSLNGPSESTTRVTDEQIAEVGSKLAEFFLKNPDSRSRQTDDALLVLHPWGDSTLQIKVEPGNHQLIDALNAVYLPPRFTAIFHRETSELECLWTAARPDDPRRSRSFRFSFKGRDYDCAFEDASPRALALAAAWEPASHPTATDWRNLPYLAAPFLIREGAIPSSFWIRGLTWDEAEVVELARNLNFYMEVHDPSSPIILIHEIPQPDLPTQAVATLPSTFPDKLNGRPLDAYELLLWESVHARDPFLQFIYLYQILEYAAYYHLDASTAEKAKRILASPGALSASDETVRQLIDVIAGFRVQDEPKIVALFDLAMLPDVLWKDFEPNLRFFAAPVSFDGGLQLMPLLQETWGVSDFATGAFPKLASTYVKIRNGLVHARERRMSDVIHPTSRNAALLRPWLTPLRTIAAHCMLYESL